MFCGEPLHVWVKISGVNKKFCSGVWTSRSSYASTAQTVDAWCTCPFSFWSFTIARARLSFVSCGIVLKQPNCLISLFQSNPVFCCSVRTPKRFRFRSLKSSRHMNGNIFSLGLSLSPRTRCLGLSSGFWIQSVQPTSYCRASTLAVFLAKRVCEDWLFQTLSPSFSLGCSGIAFVYQKENASLTFRLQSQLAVLFERALSGVLPPGVPIRADSLTTNPNEVAASVMDEVSNWSLPFNIKRLLFPSCPAIFLTGTTTSRVQNAVW